MITPQPTGWQAIQAEVLRRVHAREWPPGHIIPGEVDLATEFGCARATVNRALQALADAGILERRRKAGTRVAMYPVGRAVLDIPVLRQDIEERGHVYAYRLLEQSVMEPDPVSAQKLGCKTQALHVRAVHLA
ncbi:MAG: GntR family transcriptional regulator, partial [Pseudomonadota bacterium]